MDLHQLKTWCSHPAEALETHPDRRVPFRLVQDRTTMGELMAREFVDLIKAQNAEDRPTRAIVPCGPNCWYEPWTRIINEEQVSLKNLFVFHMDECLDWQGNLLPDNHPFNFRNSMEKVFYGGIPSGLNVPEDQRFYPDGKNSDWILEHLHQAPIDLTLGGWGQDGHVAYNQARRHPYSTISLDQLRNSSIRVQENNLDTILALAHRTFGAAYQFVPPMSVTLGVRECFSAKKVRVFSDTGSWKQTALRVALFSEPTTEYPFTLLQEHPDALLTATLETARHPIAENPEWDLF